MEVHYACQTDRFSHHTGQRAVVLFAEGDPCKGAWIVMRGKVGLAMRSGVRRRLTITYAEPGAVLGIAEAIGGGNYLTSAVAATNIEVQFVSRADLFEIMNDDPLTGMELVQMLSGDLGRMYESIRGLKLNDVVRPN